MTYDDMGRAAFLAKELYGVELSTSKFEELALIAHNLIGNKQIRVYQYIGEVNSEDNSLELPCNADIIESVTADPEDWNYVTNNSWEGDISSAHTEQYIESQKRNTDPLYQSGHLLQYNRIGNTLYFKDCVGKVKVLYKGEYLGEDGLPKISDKEALAIAAYVAYITKMKEVYMTLNQNVLAAAQMLKMEWLRACDAARVPDYINQNDMDKVLDAMSSWNRKVHNKSFKPVR